MISFLLGVPYETHVIWECTLERTLPHLFGINSEEAVRNASKATLAFSELVRALVASERAQRPTRAPCLQKSSCAAALWRSAGPGDGDPLTGQRSLARERDTRDGCAQPRLLVAELRDRCHRPATTGTVLYEHAWGAPRASRRRSLQPVRYRFMNKLP
jgi:hypothetical protein